MFTFPHVLLACNTNRRNLTGADLLGTLPPHAGWQLPDSLEYLGLGDNRLRGGWAGDRDRQERDRGMLARHSWIAHAPQAVGILRVLTALQPILPLAGTIPVRWTLPPLLQALYIWCDAVQAAGTAAVRVPCSGMQRGGRLGGGCNRDPHGSGWMDTQGCVGWWEGGWHIAHAKCSAQGEQGRKPGSHRQARTFCPALELTGATSLQEPLTLVGGCQIQ